MNRRGFLQISAAGGAGLLIGFQWGCKDDDDGTSAPEATTDETPEPTGPPEKHQVTAWLRVDSDDTVTISVPESEMGQGVLTSLPMIVAGQVGADWKQVRSAHAPVNPDAFGRQSTGGSTSIRKGIDSVRRAGATAREMLVAAAASQWKVPAGECEARGGQVVHTKGERSARFGELAAAAAELDPPDDPAIRSDDEIVGTAAARLDIPPKVTGEAVFGIDVRRPGMVVARVLHCPIFGGELASFEGEAARKIDGVRDVVAIPTGVAVVGDHFWAAHKGAAEVKAEWKDNGWGDLSTDSVKKRLRAAAPKGVEVRSEGDVGAALKKGKRLTATYEVPYLAHAPMEPLSCTAEVTGDGCELWVSTQSPSGAQKRAAEITGLDPEAIQVHTMLLGGGFGRRSQDDFVADAVHLSKKLGKPVKVMWTREDDVRGGYYRPVAHNDMTGAVDGDGWPVAWRHRIASAAILDQFGPLKDGVDRTAVEGAQNVPYAIPNLLVSYANPDLPVTTWFWRSVGSSQNAYVTECFLDELAALGGKDPLEVRRRLLKEHPRHSRVLERAAEKAGWGDKPAEGRARGLAVHESFGSIVAQVAEVSVDEGTPRVHRVVCAVDCGQVINPDTIRAQMESGIAYGLSAALFGKIDLKDGRAVQSNFHDYPVVRMGQMPAVETVIVAEGDPHGGIGEPGLPPIAPAVCNALRALTGKPVRRLPIELEA